MRAPIVVLSALALPAAAQDCDWQQISSTAPAFHSLKVVYDPGNARTLAVGIRAVQLNVWSYTPETGWTLLTVGGPPPLADFSLAFDSARNRLVLFGGFAFNAPYPETREWDGTTWTTVATTGPSVRGSASMVYDAARTTTLLFGGAVPGAAPIGDTWTWNGTQWLPATPSSSPPAQANAPIAYDPARARPQLLSMATGSLWEWTGQQWLERGIPPAPASGQRTLFYNTVDHRLNLAASEFRHAELTHVIRELKGSDWTIRAANGPQTSLGTTHAFDESRGISLQFLNPSIWRWKPDASTRVPWVESLTPPQIAEPGSSVQIHATSNGSEPLTYQWFHYNSPLTNTPPYSGVDSPTLTIDPFWYNTSGPISIRITNACGSTTASTSVGYVSQCYANCDGSTVPPIVNLADFNCFLGALAAGSSYANCDNSTTPPIINVLDYACFLNAYANGCSAP